MFARVYLLDLPYAADRLYDYFLPDPLLPHVTVGSIVTVPFGRGESRRYACIAELAETSEVAEAKSVLTYLSPRFQPGEELYRLSLFLRDHTLCTAGEALHALLPPGIFSGVQETFYPVKGLSPLPEDAALLSPFLSRPFFSASEVEKALGVPGLRAAYRSLKNGSLLGEAQPLPPENIRKKRIYFATDKAADALSPVGGIRLRSALQKSLLTIFVTQGEMEAEEALSTADAGMSQLQGLVAKGLVAYREEEVTRNPYAALSGERDVSPILLSEAQNRAYETLSVLEKRDKPEAALLYGVTGSGKTRVMLKLLDDVLAKGRTAILMVPEIALTPQTVAIFCRRYGERVAVIHSSLSAGERFDAWRRIRDGDADLVIGTRSAVFAPLRNIGLIIIDEEHEHTYKSDQNPKYHTRDVAAFRCGVHNTLMVLSSATPSIESFYKAEHGTYTLVPIRERYGNARLPETRIVDMREELRKGNRSPISEPLLSALTGAKAQKKQAILFLNRRGYNSAVSCRGCGEAITCPHCSVALTYHRDRGGYLFCHCCGYKSFPPKSCPSCGDTHLSYVGTGTEKAESELSALLPEATVLRMDADTTGHRSAYERLLSRFRNGESDILLGTQMVTKGHDFPKVTVSGVLLADTSLYVNDFRAGERTFSLLTQVIGRAGRGEHAGVAVIQTFAPQNPVIRLAAKQDYEAFYRDEIALRKSTLFPPFCDLAQLTLTSDDEQALLRAAATLSQTLQKRLQTFYPDLPLQAFGPFPAGTYKAGGKYRMRMILKCRLSDRTRHFLGELLRDYGKEHNHILLSVDLNPSTV